jgi:hypothetical protein
MKKLLKTCAVSMMFLLSVSGVVYSADSARDQANGITGDSWRAEQRSTSPGNYKDLDSSWEKTRKEAGQGFDSGRSGNLRGGGEQYIPTPQPKIDNNVKK